MSQHPSGLHALLLPNNTERCGRAAFVYPSIGWGTLRCLHVWVPVPYFIPSSQSPLREDTAGATPSITEMGTEAQGGEVASLRCHLAL